MAGLQGYIAAQPGYYQTAQAVYQPYTITTGTAIVPKSTFEQAFKIAQLMVDRPVIAADDLKGFLQLIKDIQSALDES